jgi:putative membrane protein
VGPGLGLLDADHLGRDRCWRRSPRRRPATSPEEILAERYARGEISTEEYHERLAVLRESGG